MRRHRERRLRLRCYRKYGASQIKPGNNRTSSIPISSLWTKQDVAAGTLEGLTLEAGLRGRAQGRRARVQGPHMRPLQSFQVLSFTVNVGPLPLTDATPLSRAAVLEYISLRPMT
jgi:hypothetical protein